MIALDHGGSIYTPPMYFVFIDGNGNDHDFTRSACCGFYLSLDRAVPIVQHSDRRVGLRGNDGIRRWYGHGDRAVFRRTSASHAV